MNAIRLLPMLALLAAVSATQGQEPAGDTAAAADSWESAAAKLQQATLTVRIGNKPTAADRPESVTVCSGVCVREGRIITAAMAGSDSTIRLTLAGGKQADARLQVIDEFTGLALLACDTKLGVPMALSARLPSVGGGAMTASGWGVEEPLVSLGIVAGVERHRPGVSYPPLIQCDLRTTDTSSGSGVVDRQGKLVGVIVAADSPESRRGWAYAVPAAHVERLLRAADEQKTPGVMVIKRRRPVVGLVLDQDEEAILVQRVMPGGPADKAGIKPGDVVLETEGVVIRSVYQAVLPTLHKQPGDTITFRIQRASGGTNDVRVVLGGGLEMTSAPVEWLSGLMQPKVEIVRDAAGNIARGGSGRMPAEVFQPPLPAEDLAGEPPATPAEKIALLEKALDRYRSVIELQQQQLAGEQKQRQEQEQQLRSLRTELETLGRQLERAGPK
ncbi:MAG: S1C family serine protease [Pirellulaceae bacterium]